MKTPQARLAVAALAAQLAAAPCLAQGPIDYARFQPAPQEYAILYGAEYGRCIDAIGGVMGKLSECSAAEFNRLDARLNRSYRTTLARLPNRAARLRLRNLERQWLTSSWDLCRQEASPQPGGTMSLFIMELCSLAEVSRRILWLERCQDRG